MRFAGEVTFLMTSSSFSIICARFADRLFLLGNFRPRREEFAANRIARRERQHHEIERFEQARTPRAASPVFRGLPCVRRSSLVLTVPSQLLREYKLDRGARAANFTHDRPADEKQVEASGGAILPCSSFLRGVLAQLVRAPPCHGGGCGFEPRRLRFITIHQIQTACLTMRKSSSISCAIFFTLLLTASLLTPPVFAADRKTEVTKQPPVMTKNPLLSESTLPYHYPPFDQIKDEHYEPAYMQGMAEELKEVEAIAANKEKPTFDNTIVALERSGRTLARVDHVFSNLSGANTNEAIQKIEAALAPKLSAHQDAIHLNSALFARIQSLYNDRDKLNLDTEQKWLLERYYKDFVRAGAKLSEPDKTKLKAMNAELASLQTTFKQNVQKEKNNSSIVVDNRDRSRRLVRCRTRGRDGGSENWPQRRQVCFPAAEHDRTSAARFAAKPPIARANHASFARS